MRSSICVFLGVIFYSTTLTKAGLFDLIDKGITSGMEVTNKGIGAVGGFAGDAMSKVQNVQNQGRQHFGKYRNQAGDIYGRAQQSMGNAIGMGQNVMQNTQRGLGATYGQAANTFNTLRHSGSGMAQNMQQSWGQQNQWDDHSGYDEYDEDFGQGYEQGYDDYNNGGYNQGGGYPQQPWGY